LLSTRFSYLKIAYLIKRIGIIACVDGLAAFLSHCDYSPEIEIQLCVFHQIRNSMKYVASKNQKAFMANYRAVSKEAAEIALDELEAKWGGSYPITLSIHNTSGRLSIPQIQWKQFIISLD